MRFKVAVALLFAAGFLAGCAADADNGSDAVAACQESVQARVPNRMTAHFIPYRVDTIRHTDGWRVSGGFRVSGALGASQEMHYQCETDVDSAVQTVVLN